MSHINENYNENQKLYYAYNTSPEWMHNYTVSETQWIGRKLTSENSFALYFDEPTDRIEDVDVKLIYVGKFQGSPAHKIFNNQYQIKLPITTIKYK